MSDHATPTRSDVLAFLDWSREQEQREAWARAECTAIIATVDEVAAEPVAITSNPTRPLACPIGIAWGFKIMAALALIAWGIWRCL